MKADESVREAVRALLRHGGFKPAGRSKPAAEYLVKAAKERRWDEVREIWRLLEPAMNLIWQGDYVQSVYAAADITGYGAGQPRRPLRALAADKRQILKVALGDLAEREAMPS